MLNPESSRNRILPTYIRTGAILLDRSSRASRCTPLIPDKDPQLSWHNEDGVSLMQLQLEVAFTAETHLHSRLLIDKNKLNLGDSPGRIYVTHDGRQALPVPRQTVDI